LYSLGSDKPILQTTHGLKNHLAKCHKEINNDYLKRVAENDDDRECKKAKIVADERKMKISVQPIVQPTVTAMLDRRTPFADDSDIVKRIDKAIMDLIIVDMLPCTVVEGEAFKRLNFADPAGLRRYTPKSEKYYRTLLVPGTYDKVVEQVKKLLMKIMWVSFTTDAWTNPTKTCSLLSLGQIPLQRLPRDKLETSRVCLEEVGFQIPSERLPRMKLETNSRQARDVSSLSQTCPQLFGFFPGHGKK
jgi:hypothetical protein